MGKCKGNEQQNVQYCTKSEKFRTNIRLIKDVIKEKGAYSWQKEIIDLCDEEPDDRSIHWYWDQKGNIGKTELAKHLFLKHGKDLMYVNGKSADVKCAIAASEIKPKIVIFGIPRTSQDYVSYAALEEIKDGIFSAANTKVVWYVFPPHMYSF